MSRRDELPAVNEYYHVFNRGVEKRIVFSDDADYRRFKTICQYYLDPKPKISFSQRERIALDIQHPVLDPAGQLIEIIAYCLMPNHFHFLVRVQAERGLQEWVRKTINSYTRSFNTRWKRVGPLFQGPYKFVRITSNDQLLHVSRYIHLNPSVARLVRDPAGWEWSSMKQYCGDVNEVWISPSVILDQVPESSYQGFVDDHLDYAMQIAKIKQLLIDGNE
jgi:putative transposase